MHVETVLHITRQFASIMEAHNRCIVCESYKLLTCSQSDAIVYGTISQRSIPITLFIHFISCT